MNPPSMARKKRIIGFPAWHAITDPVPLKATLLTYPLEVIILPHVHSFVFPLYILTNAKVVVIEELPIVVTEVSPPTASLSVPEW